MRLNTKMNSRDVWEGLLFFFNENRIIWHLIRYRPECEGMIAFIPEFKVVGSGHLEFRE